MAILSIRLSAQRPTGTWDEGREYSVPYCIMVDDPTMGPHEIFTEAIAHTDPFPEIGDFYTYASNDGESDTTAFCTGYGSPKVAAGNDKKFLVEVKYSKPSPNDESENGPDPDAGDDLDTFFQVVDIDFQEKRKSGSRYRFRAFLNSDLDQIEMPHTPVLVPDEIGPVRNSAGTPIAHEDLCYRHILRITTYALSWDNSWESFLGQWNSGDVRISEWDAFGFAFDRTYGARNLQLINIGKQSLRGKDGTLYFRLVWTLQYDPDGYFIRELDAGLDRAFVAGAWDPTILTVSSSGQRSYGSFIAAGDERLAASKAGVTRILDLDGDPVGDKVMLNGQGVEASVSNRATVDGVPNQNVPAPIYLVYEPIGALSDLSALPFAT